MALRVLLADDEKEFVETLAERLDLRGIVALDRDESADVIDACIEETMNALAEAGADVSAERFQTP